jgi:hypothetical protein
MAGRPITKFNISQSSCDFQANGRLMAMLGGWSLIPRFWGKAMAVSALVKVVSMVDED